MYNLSSPDRVRLAKDVPFSGSRYWAVSISAIHRASASVSNSGGRCGSLLALRTGNSPMHLTPALLTKPICPGWQCIFKM
jgi:hypothetical protein